MFRVQGSWGFGLGLRLRAFWVQGKPGWGRFQSAPERFAQIFAFDLLDSI